MSGTDCIIPEIGSSDFFDQLAARPAGPDGLPLGGSLELTLRCNLRCRHCYIHASAARSPERQRGGSPLADARGDREEMTTDEVCRVLDQLADAGVLNLLLTGGEIFVRRDFKEIYLHARRRGFLLTLFTNATRVNEELANFLAAHAPRRIEISLYGHSAGTYEAVTGLKGSFTAFRNGLEHLLRRKLPVYLKAMLLRSNAHEFSAMKAWAESLNRPFRFDAVVNTRLDGGRHPFAERLPAGEVARWQHEASGEKSRPSEWRQKVEGREADPRLFRCGAGRMTFHLDPRGCMHPCLMWRNDPYDLLEGSITGWHKHLEGILSRQAPAESRCSTCKDRLICASCAATSAQETGKPGLHVEYFCDICRARVDRASNTPA